MDAQPGQSGKVWYQIGGTRVCHWAADTQQVLGVEGEHRADVARIQWPGKVCHAARFVVHRVLAVFRAVCSPEEGLEEEGVVEAPDKTVPAQLESCTGPCGEIDSGTEMRVFTLVF